MKHSELRANERYGITKINDSRIISDILNDKCVQIKSDIERFSRCFMVLISNKYVKVITDFNIQFVKTVLPYTNKDFDYVCELSEKLNRYSTIAA